MKKSDVLAHFKTAAAVAEALKIKPSAVSQWGEYIPPRRAYELEEVTNGQLKRAAPTGARPAQAGGV